MKCEKQRCLQFRPPPEMVVHSPRLDTKIEIDLNRENMIDLSFSLRPFSQSKNKSLALGIIDGGHSIFIVTNPSRRCLSRVCD